MQIAVGIRRILDYILFAVGYDVFIKSMYSIVTYTAKIEETYFFYNLNSFSLNNLSALFVKILCVFLRIYVICLKNFKCIWPPYMKMIIRAAYSGLAYCQIQHVLLFLYLRLYRIWKTGIS